MNGQPRSGGTQGDEPDTGVEDQHTTASNINVHVQQCPHAREGNDTLSQPPTEAAPSLRATPARRDKRNDLPAVEMRAGAHCFIDRSQQSCSTVFTVSNPGGSSSSQTTSWWKRAWNFVGAVSIVLSIVLAVPVVGGWIKTWQEERTPITINQPPNDVNRCAVLEGTAHGRSGRQLWFAHRDLRDPVHYFFTKPTVRQDNTWQAIVHLGRPDTVRSQYKIYVFYVSNDTSRFLDDLSTDSVNGPAGTYWMSRDLPPTTQGLETITVTRRGDPENCP